MQTPNLDKNVIFSLKEPRTEKNAFLQLIALYWRVMWQGTLLDCNPTMSFITRFHCIILLRECLRWPRVTFMV